MAASMCAMMATWTWDMKGALFFLLHVLFMIRLPHVLDTHDSLAPVTSRVRPLWRVAGPLTTLGNDGEKGHYTNLYTYTLAGQSTKACSKPEPGLEKKRT